MLNLDNKIPPPLIVTLCGAAMWGIALYTPGIEVAGALRIVGAGAVALAGVFFCMAGVVSFRRAQTTVNPLKPDAASALVRSGIYHVSRNPMYVGFALLLVSWAVFLSSPLALLGVGVFMLYINRFQIAPEERALSMLFGAEFERYKNAVRRWI